MDFSIGANHARRSRFSLQPIRPMAGANSFPRLRRLRIRVPPPLLMTLLPHQIRNDDYYFYCRRKLSRTKSSRSNGIVTCPRSRGATQASVLLHRAASASPSNAPTPPTHRRTESVAHGTLTLFKCALKKCRGIFPFSPEHSPMT